jgi:hypothetical protein
VEEAIEELLICRGTQFDPQMVDALVLAVSHLGWEPAKPPTAEELSAQLGAPVFDDDDPMIPEPVDEPRFVVGEQARRPTISEDAVTP